MRHSPRALGLVAVVCSGCPAAPCDDRCGSGTVCIDGKCVVAAIADASPTDAEVDADPQLRKKGRKRKGGKADDGETGLVASGPAPVFDDSNVPRYDPDRTQAIGAGDGSERLSDRTVQDHLAGLEPAFNRCIEQIVQAGVDVGTGNVAFEIGIEPTGKVWGVTARAPAKLKDSGAVACMRKAIHAHRFPKWDGPAMGVDYAFDVR